jgi:hydrogenase maturation protease
MIPQVLILGWGNLSRGDDALGPLLLQALRSVLPDSLCDQLELIDDYQLQIEHALDMHGRARVLFVDASLSCTAPFEVTALQAQQDASYTTHRLSAPALMHIYQNLQGALPPPCTLLAIRGEAFELGEPLSTRAQSHLAQALLWAQNWISNGTTRDATI